MRLSCSGEPPNSSAHATFRVGSRLPVPRETKEPRLIVQVELFTSPQYLDTHGGVLQALFRRERE